MFTLDKLHNRAVGKRVFILGNGPSLLKQDLTKLASEDTFCCNRFAQWDKMPWTPTYYACNATKVEEGVEPEKPPYRVAKFLCSYPVTKRQGWVVVKKGREKPVAGCGQHLWYVRSKGSMTFVMVQIALWLGYTRIYLLGVDMKAGGHVFDPEGTKIPFIPPPEDQIDDEWGELRFYARLNGHVLTDCTPDGRLNFVLGYKPLEEVLNTAPLPIWR